jgi:hypothetical protein
MSITSGIFVKGDVRLIKNKQLNYFSTVYFKKDENYMSVSDKNL